MSSITASDIETPVRRSVEQTCDDLAILALVIVGLTASLTFRDYGLGWDADASWLAGIALSTTSMAVVYTVMLESGLNQTDFGFCISICI